MKCSNCGSEIADDAQFCGICGQETKVTSCPNCGVSLKQGLFFCPSCGVKLKEKTQPQIEVRKEEPKLSKLDQEIKEQEIRRLIKVNQKRFSTAKSREPKTGLLTDEEILKYAPESKAAERIKLKNADSLLEKIMVAPTYSANIGLLLFFAVVILITFLYIWI